MAVSEAELSCDVPLPVLEDQNAGLVHLDGVLFPLRPHSVIHIGLLTSRETAVDLDQETAVDHFVQNDSGARVETLFHCGPVFFVLDSDLLLVVLHVRGGDLVHDGMRDLDLPVVHLH